MRFTLLRKLTVFSVLIAASACNRLPVEPSANPFINETEPPNPVSLTLSNFSSTSVGVSSEMCTDGDPAIIDDLSMDYEIIGGTLSRALVLACDTAECASAVPLGSVTECSVPPNPCDAVIREAMDRGTAPVCLTGSLHGSGTAHVFAKRGAEGPKTWNLVAYVDSTGDRSNTVSTTVE